MLKKDGIYLIGRKPRTGKEERLVRLEPLFSQGKVFIKPHMTEFTKEFMDFPRGRHDDIMDGFDLAYGCSYRPSNDPVLDAASAKKRKEKPRYDHMLA